MLVTRRYAARWLRCCRNAAGFLSVAGCLIAQSAAQPQGVPQTSPSAGKTVEQPAEKTGTVIRSNVREVVLDVVVRRKDLTLNKKLKASDFKITEDGVPQTIKTFRFVGGDETRVTAPAPEAIGPAVKTVAPQVNSTREPNFVSIIFDQIGPDSRKNAEEAATDFLSQQFAENTYAAVFGLNLRLNAVQGFTNDRAALARAVHLAVTGNSQELAQASASVLNETNYLITGGPTGITLTPGLDLSQRPDLSTSGAAQAPFSEAQQYMAQMITAQRDMTSYGIGMKVLASMMLLVKYESGLPGRKTVLYLSDGLVKPPDRQDYMKAVIGAANRGNISFYCIDVRGLTTATSNGMVSGLTQTAGNLSAAQAGADTQSVGGDQISPSQGMALALQGDLIQTALSSHTQLNMAEIAEGTGGFAIFNTNDFKHGMARVMEDVRTHYEISYVPTSTAEDGKFRAIKVTVNDPKLIVQSRSGYYAVPQMKGGAVVPFEMAGLKALNTPGKTDFPFHVAALRYKPLPDGFRYEIVFDLSTASLTTDVDEKTQKARIHATFLALIKDQSGQIVQKVSQEIDREVPEDKLDMFRRGEMIFTNPVELTSGRYLIEAAVTDPEGGLASTKRVALVVPKPGEPAVSSIAVVHDVDSLVAPRDPGNPLEFDGGKVLPALPPVVKPQTDAAVFFVVYPELDEGKPTDEKPQVVVEILQNGKQVSRATPDLGLPDEVNTFPVISSAKLPPGDYVVKVTVQQAGRMSVETTALTVNP
ncbi:MAG: VWA domain-containing protein [Bryobacteraceae bacterium]